MTGRGLCAVRGTAVRPQGGVDGLAARGSGIRASCRIRWRACQVGVRPPVGTGTGSSCLHGELARPDGGSVNPVRGERRDGSAALPAPGPASQPQGRSETPSKPKEEKNAVDRSDDWRVLRGSSVGLLTPPTPAAGPGRARSANRRGWSAGVWVGVCAWCLGAAAPPCLWETGGRCLVWRGPGAQVTAGERGRLWLSPSIPVRAAHAMHEGVTLTRQA
jgi:hypothetical protein